MLVHLCISLCLSCDTLKFSPDGGRIISYSLCWVRRIGAKYRIVVYLRIREGYVLALIGNVVVGDGRWRKSGEIKVGVWVERIAEVISHGVLYHSLRLMWVDDGSYDR